MLLRCLILIPLIASHFAAAQRIIEEVAAVVGTTPVLQSDVSLAELVRLRFRKRAYQL